MKPIILADLMNVLESEAVHDSFPPLKGSLSATLFIDVWMK